VAIVDGRQATLANIGDSGAAEVYADKNDGRLVGQMLTVAHKPHVEAEQRRIVSAGGAVQQVRGAWRVVPRALSGSNRSLCKTVDSNRGA
jgi:serine/threonine protein phosphatase PrpC